MKKIKAVILVSIMCITLFTACTKQELNEEEKLTSFTDKPKVRRPGGGR